LSVLPIFLSRIGVEPEPFQLGEHLVEASGKLLVIDNLLKYLKTAGHKVLMFSQMTHMLDVLQDYLGYRGEIGEGPRCVLFYSSNDTT